MAKTVTILNVRSRDYTHRGERRPGPVAMGHHAEIVPGESITLMGERDVCFHAANTNDEKRYITTKAEYRITFRIGDLAEYDSYNLVYLGRIVSITEKGVTIEAHGRRHRLDVYGFSNKNCDFDLESIQRRNHATSMAI